MAGGLISWPYGLIYHIRSIREESADSSFLENSMLRVRRDAREPGRFASSSSSSNTSSSKTPMPFSEPGADGAADGAKDGGKPESAEDGCEIWFWPMITVSSASPAAMW